MAGEFSDVMQPPPMEKVKSWKKEPLRDTPFRRHKAFFYMVRLLRELVPAISISLCLFDFFTFSGFF